MQKTISYLFLLTIITGVFFTACTSNSDDIIEENKPVAESKNDPFPETNNEPVVQVTTKYNDGTYTGSGGYQSPAGPESISITVTVEKDVIKFLSVSPGAVNETAKIYQGLFIQGINALVVGKNLDQIGGFSQVNGSSLTSGGFNSALAAVKVSAAK